MDTIHPQQRFAILGAGSWGTAVAIHLAQGGHSVLLWGHDPKHVVTMQQDRQNARYLPQVAFPTGLELTANLNDCSAANQLVIMAVPSHAFAAVLSKLPKPTGGLAWLTKGIDPQSHQLLHQLVTKKWGNDYPFAIISGPSFAKEVAQSLPTALVIAGNQLNYLKTLQTAFHHGHTRAYLSEDAIGVQLCGAVKNVLAIACGVSDGLQFGANAKAALITRGLAEMTRLGLAMGAKQETFMGLAGVGDLVLTCTDNQSRNRRFGLLLGQGSDIDSAEATIGQVVEGRYNAAQVCLLAAQQGVEMPICEMVNALLLRQVDAKQAVAALMSRPPREE